MVRMLVWNWLSTVGKKLKRKTKNFIVIAVWLALIAVIVFSGCTHECDPKIEYNPTIVFNSGGHLPSIIKQVISTSVYVDSNEWSGSGVIVGPNTVLTAGHVVEDANNLEVHTAYGKIYKAAGSKYDPNNDCGLIFIKETFKDIAGLGDSNLVEVGDGVLIIGSPYGKELFNAVAYGIVASVDRQLPFWNEVNTFVIDVASNPGNSGGPVFDMDGKVIGIVVGGWWGADGLTAVTPINICKELLYEVSICR